MNILSKKSICIVFVMSVTIYWASSITGEPGWGDDYAMYITHAQNIADGNPYTEMGFIHGLTHYWMSPIAASPGLPMFLAPIYKIFGLNFFAFKIVQLMVFFLFSIVLYALIMRMSSRRVALLTVASFSLNPYVIKLSQGIVTEYTYLLCSVLSLYVGHLIARESGLRKTAFLMAFFGALTYISFSVREVGLLLPVSFFVYYSINNIFKEPKKLVLLAPMVVTFLLGYLSQKMLFPEIHQDTNLCFECVPANLLTYLRSISQLFYVDILPELYYSPLSKVLAVFYIIFFFVGIGVTKKDAFRGLLKGDLLVVVQSLSMLDWFVLANLAVILPLDIVSAPRYLIPVLPYVMFYFSVGICSVIDLLGKPKLIYIFLPLSGILFYSGINYDLGGGDGVTNKASQGLFEFIENEIPDSAVISFAKPRVLALMTGKKTTLRPNKHSTYSEVIPYFKEVGVTHVIVPNRSTGLGMSAWMLEMGILDRRLKVEYENDGFMLLNIEPLYSNLR